MKFGNPILIQNSLDYLLNSENVRRWQGGKASEQTLREIDARIALAVFAHPLDDLTYVSDTLVPFAIVINTPRSVMNPLSNDLIEFANPIGSGWILMAAAKVPHFTTSLDDGLTLIPAGCKWSMADTGLVKLKRKPWKFRMKLLTPALSLSAIGLMVQLKLREQDR